MPPSASAASYRVGGGGSVHHLDRAEITLCLDRIPRSDVSGLLNILQTARVDWVQSLRMAVGGKAENRSVNYCAVRLLGNWPGPALDTGFICVMKLQYSSDEGVVKVFLFRPMCLHRSRRTSMPHPLSLSDSTSGPAPSPAPPKMKTNFTGIPIVDFSLFHSDPPKYFEQLRFALEDVGFVVFVNVPGFEDSFQKKLFARAEYLFSKPQTWKDALGTQNSYALRGYFRADDTYLRSSPGT